MLKIENIVKAFDGFVALKGVSLEAKPGQITGLIGPNGSGKTTLFNVVTGIYSMDSGQVRLFGQNLDLRRPDIVARRGVVRTFQVPRVAMRMTVFENLLMSPTGQISEKLHQLFSPVSLISAQEAEIQEKAWEMLDFLDLTNLANDWAGTLSGGQLKLLSLGMVLMSDPVALLLDEPVAGVNYALIARILETLDTIREQDKIILIVEHNIQVISDICSDVYVLDAGEIISHGAPSKVRADPMVRQAYLGVKG
jgi:ABC-type branched-subunit amino acid transport system ATPase component